MIGRIDAAPRSSVEVRLGACRLCPAWCPVEATIEDGVVTEVRGDAQAPLYGGFTCRKGRALPQALNGAARLRATQVRRADGSFTPVASATAIDEIAARLEPIVAEHGPDSVAVYLGNAVLAAPITGSLAMAFNRALGTPWTLSPTTLDQPGIFIANACHGEWLGGRTSYEDADAFLFVGANPVTSKQWLAQDPATRLRRGLERGCRIVVIDPRRTPTARHAHVHLRPRPGEDASVIAGLLHCIVRDGNVDEGFVARHVGGVDALAAAVERFTPEYVAQRAEVDVAELREAAQILGTASRGGTAPGTGITMSGRGSLNHYLLLCLHSLRGWWGRAGDDARVNVLLPPLDHRAEAVAGATPARGPTLPASGLHPSLAGFPCSAIPAQILTPGPGRIRALICSGGNPASSWPDHQATHDALVDLELLVSIDPVMSATAQLSHYVIAPRIQLEVAATTQLVESITHPGYGWDVPYARAVAPIVEPPTGADLIEEWQFFYRLAQRMGLELELVQSFRSRGGHVELHAPVVTPLDMAREPQTEELYEIVTQHAAVPLAEVRRHERGRVFTEAGQRVAPPRPGATARLDVGNETMLAELAEVFSQKVEPAERGRPFLLVPRRADAVYNSYGHDLVARRHPSPPNPAYMHREDLAALGLRSGDEVVLTSDAGTLRAIVATDPDAAAGVISMSHGFGVHAGVRTDPQREGSNTNALSSLTDVVDVETGQVRMGAIPVSVDQPRRDRPDDGQGCAVDT